MRASAVVCLFTFSALGAGNAALAQVQDDSATPDIVVTATKTGETKLQNTPIAISAYSGDLLGRQGVRDIRDLAQMTPNLTISENTSFSQTFIRGVGSNNVFAGSDPSSTVHLDGVYIARPVSYFNSFFDVERVEVLRGPQGTLYGRNSVGGTINVISRKPNDKISAKFEAGYGNYDSVQLAAYANLPLAEDLYASVSGLYTAHDAYVKNVNPSGNNIDDDDTRGVRGQLRWTPGPFDIVLRADYSKSDGAIMGYSKLLEPRGSAITDALLGNYRRIANNIPHEFFRKNYGFAADIDIELSDRITLKSLTAYRNSRFHASFDTDASDEDRQRSILDESQDQISQEFNLSGEYGAFTFVLGAFYFTETMDYPISIENRINLTDVHTAPHVETDSYAFFQQTDWHITDTLNATFGLRYSKEKKQFSQYATRRSLVTYLPVAPVVEYDTTGHYDAWTPKFGLDWRPTEDIMTYASVSRGFKSGGFVNGSTNPSQGFGPETLWAYEAGIKTSWLDRRLILNLSAFYYDYKNLQVNFFLAPGVVDIRNAADATIKGLELEFNLRPFRTTRIQGGVSLLDAKYDSFPSAPRRGNQSVFDASGADLNGAPDHMVTLSVEQDLPAIAGFEPTLRGDASWNGRRYFTPENNALESQAPYFLLNASLHLRSENGITMTLWGRNLTNREYVTGTASFASGLVAGRPGYPRTYGLKLGYSF